MAFVHLVDKDGNEHYVNMDAIVNVRTTMSGGTFVDVNGLDSPIFMQKSARQVLENLLSGEVLEREPVAPPPAPAAASNGDAGGLREPGADEIREPGADEIREPGTFIVES